MGTKQEAIAERSALANSNVSSIVNNTGFSGGRGCGRNSSQDGGQFGGRNNSRGGESQGYGGNGRGFGQPNFDTGKPYCTYYGQTHHTQANCWDLHGKPPTASATPAETEYRGDKSK